MNKIERVEHLLKTNIPDAIIQTHDLTGNMDHLHLGILVVSEQFKGKPLLDQHQLVMDILKPSLAEEVHAVKIKTMTPEKYQRIQEQQS